MPTEIHGVVEPGFEAVADAFATNFSVHGDRGAACTIIIEGSTVLDIYAGEMREGRAWTDTTRSVVFSVSKAVTTICLLMAADRGLIDLDEPVAASWPEFGVHGKHAITVRQALAHRAGAVSFARPWSSSDLAEWYPIVEDLAAQHPVWEPGTAFAYHPVSFGFIAGEVLRRATGLRPAQWLEQYVNVPLGLQMTYGTDGDDANLAHMRQPLPAEGIGVPLSAEDIAFVTRAMLADGAYAPDVFTALNTSAALRPESPAANLVTTARDLARLFSATVYPARAPRLIGERTLEQALAPLSSGQPFIGPDKGDVWGTGFMLHSTRRGMAGPGSFGHDGAGGQLAFGHAALGLGFGYQTVQPSGDDDPRAEALCSALRSAL